MKMKLLFILLSVGSFLLDHGADSVEVSVMEGDSVTLHTGVQKTQQDTVKWYYDGIRIAQINGNPSTTCTDVQCKGGTDRFRGRLKPDHQTGSLTIMNIRTTDSGEYKWTISSDSGNIVIVSVTGTGKAKAAQIQDKTDITVPGSGPSSGVAAGVVVAVLLLQLLV